MTTATTNTTINPVSNETKPSQSGTQPTRREQYIRISQVFAKKGLRNAFELHRAISARVTDQQYAEAYAIALRDGARKAHDYLVGLDPDYAQYAIVWNAKAEKPATKPSIFKTKPSIFKTKAPAKPTPDQVRAALATLQAWLDSQG